MTTSPASLTMIEPKYVSVDDGAETVPDASSVLVALSIRTHRLVVSPLPPRTFCTAQIFPFRTMTWPLKRASPVSMVSGPPGCRAGVGLRNDSEVIGGRLTVSNDADA